MAKLLLSDREIHRMVLEELKWDTWVDETEVGVEVDQGVVTLTGSVDSYAKRWAAQDAAHRVAGVLDVANEIRVSVPYDKRRDDTDIARAVRDALEWDAFVPAEMIRSTVSGGWVTLSGSVRFCSERERAARVVRDLNGVTGITNEIEVASVRVSPDAVRAGIESALERRAEREARHVAVAVLDSTVVLSGHVNSWMDKEAIVGAAGSASGVKKVEDHLHITPA